MQITNTESLGCAPESDIMWDVNYTLIKKGKSKKRKNIHGTTQQKQTNK